MEELLPSVLGPGVPGEPLTSEEKMHMGKGQVRREPGGKCFSMSETKVVADERCLGQWAVGSRLGNFHLHQRILDQCLL